MTNSTMEAETSTRVRTVCLVLREACRLRAAEIGGQVVRIKKHRDSRCSVCRESTYTGQVLVRTFWRPVTMGQVRMAGGFGPFDVYECASCALKATTRQIA
jgi:hypothetical protein